MLQQQEIFGVRTGFRQELARYHFSCIDKCKGFILLKVFDLFKEGLKWLDSILITPNESYNAYSIFESCWPQLKSLMKSSGNKSV